MSGMKLLQHFNVAETIKLFGADDMEIGIFIASRNRIRKSFPQSMADFFGTNDKLSLLFARLTRALSIVSQSWTTFHLAYLSSSYLLSSMAACDCKHYVGLLSDATNLHWQCFYESVASGIHSQAQTWIIAFEITENVSFIGNSCHPPTLHLHHPGIKLGKVSTEETISFPSGLKYETPVVECALLCVYVNKSDAK